MSYNNRNSVNKPYCKVCHDAGKSEKDYNSHYVKSQDRKTGTTIVTCPTLLNTECRFCYGIGHTTKFCPALINKKKFEQREEQYQQAKKPPVPAKKQDLRSGGFSALLDEDEEEEATAPPLAPPFLKVEKVEKVEEWPTLGEPSKRIVSVPSYAAAVAKQVPIVAAAKKELPITFQVLEKGNIYERTKIEKPTFLRGRSNWADDDSDEDDEEPTNNTAW
jgi:hypothetical protein